MVSLSVASVLLISVSLFHFQCLGIEDVKGYLPSVNCVNKECAPYQVVHSQKDFEIRVYKESNWVSSPIITAASYKEAFSKGFLQLLAYIGGFNLSNLKWNMTAPVVTEIFPKSSFQVSFYLPQKLQNNPPKPVYDRNNTITLVKLPRKKFAAVTRFNSVSLDNATIAARLVALKKNLMGTQWQGATTSSDYCTANYNTPIQSTDIVTEIILWFD